MLENFFSLTSRRRNYAQICESHSGLDLVQEETFNFGISHEDIGLISAHSWGLAAEIKAAIGWHHRPGEAPETRHLCHSNARRERNCQVVGHWIRPHYPITNCLGTKFHLLNLGEDPARIHSIGRAARI